MAFLLAPVHITKVDVFVLKALQTQKSYEHIERFQEGIWMPPWKSGGIPSVSTRFSLRMDMSRLTRDGTAEAVSRDQILRRERGQGNVHLPCSADHEQDWQPYPVDHSLAICDDHTLLLIVVRIKTPHP